MFKKIKGILKSFWPMSIKIFIREIENLKKADKAINDSIREETVKVEYLRAELIEIKNELKATNMLIEKSIIPNIAQTARTTAETVWANIFHDTIKECKWGGRNDLFSGTMGSGLSISLCDVSYFK